MTEPDPQLLEIMQSLRSSKLTGHAQEIGSLCLAWSHMETVADLLLTIVTDLRDPDMRACIFHNVDMRDKISDAPSCRIRQETHGRMVLRAAGRGRACGLPHEARSI